MKGKRLRLAGSMGTGVWTRRAAAAIALLLSLPAAAQLYAPGGVVPNPYARPGQIYRNPVAPLYSINATNPYVTGNARYGQSFQGFSPIRDSSSLFISRPSSGGSIYSGSSVLPSDRLSNFTRDSFSMEDLQNNRQVATWNGALYYSPQSTVTNTGAIIQGLNRPGTSQVLSPYASPRASTFMPASEGATGITSRYAASSWGVPSRYVRVDTGRTLTGRVNQRLLSSPLFGNVVRQVSTDALIAQAAQEQSFGKPAIGPLDLRAHREALDLRVEQGAADARRSATDGSSLPKGLASPLDRLLGRQPTMDQGVGRTGREAGASGGLNAGGPATHVRSGDVFRQLQSVTGEASSSRIYGRSLGLGGAASLRGPGQRTAVGEPTADRSAGGMLNDRTKVTGLPRGEPAGRVESAAPSEGVPGERAKLPDFPLRTFVGTENSVINAYLAEAEAQMKAGQYYRAVAAYDLASVVDFRNPLPLLGRSMALLAAGDYLAPSPGSTS